MVTRSESATAENNALFHQAATVESLPILRDNRPSGAQATRLMPIGIPSRARLGPFASCPHSFPEKPSVLHVHNEDDSLPLNKSNIWAFLCRLVLYTENERGDTWRHMTAHKRDKTALIIETQMKLRGVEFHFCPSGEMGQGRAAKSSPFVWFGATSHASHQQQLQSS